MKTASSEMLWSVALIPTNCMLFPEEEEEKIGTGGMEGGAKGGAHQLKEKKIERGGMEGGA